VKIKFHSLTDIITNSSTTIYTYSDKSSKACKEMVDEIFETLGIDKSCDDVFNIVITFDDYYNYTYYADDNNIEFTEEIFNDIITGKIKKPSWMTKLEKDPEQGGTTMHITAKVPEFEDLAKRIHKFLYSTYSEEVCS
jgi:hypothetical protein